MNRGLRLIKRMVALILVLLLSIENFAAVVGDNDGAAFITKAEFDSLKNNFQSQIDQYNTSIDSKIDGAIASYLAGISVAKTENTNIVSWWNQARFMDDIMMYSKQVTYTGSAEKTESTVKWHRPNTGNRIEIESGRLALASQIAEEYGAGFAIRLSGSIADSAGSGIQNAQSGIGGWAPDTDRWALAPTLLMLWKDGNGEWCFNSTEAGLRSGKHVNKCIARTHKQSDATTSLWNFGYYNHVIEPKTDANALQFLSPGSDKIYNLKIWFKYGSNEYFIQDSPSVGDIVMPYNFGNIPTSCPQTHINMTTLNTTELRTMDMYENDSGRTRDQNNFPYLMLGRSQTWKILTAHRLPASSVGTDTKDNTNSKKIDVTWNISSRWMAYILSTPTSNTLSTGTHTGTISFPKWDEDVVNELRNGSFYYEDKAIKIGQGMPLGDRGISGNGKAKIKIQFEKKNVQTGSVATNKRVAVKIKKNDFLSEGDYATGTIDNSTTSVTFNDSLYLNAGTEYTLNVDMNKDDHLWLQLSPAGGESDIYTGNYARLTTLTMNYEIE